MIRHEREYLFPTIPHIETFRDFIDQYNHIYAEYAAWKQQQISGYNGITDTLATSIHRIMNLPAKRVRPLLIYAAHRLFPHTQYPHEVIKLCTAAETFHTFALIHDDITDQAKTRRGQPTIEEELVQSYAHLGGSKARHLGLNAALYAGDILLWQSTMMVNFLKVPQRTLERIQDIFYEMELEVVAGQNDDGFGIVHEKWSDITEDRIKKIFAYKSGRYSIQKPLMLGAALAEVDDTTLHAIARLGDDFGVVFQIKDDLLGVFGNEAEMGKSASSDIMEGKRTLLMYYTYQKADNEGKKLIESVVGNSEATIEDIEKVRTLIKKTGVKEEMEQYCYTGAQAFIEGLHQLNNTDPHYRSILESLAQYVVNRDT